MSRREILIEGDPVPGGPFSLMVNGEIQDGRYPTIEAALAAGRRGDKYVEVWRGNRRVWGKACPEPSPEVAERLDRQRAKRAKLPVREPYD